MRNRYFTTTKEQYNNTNHTPDRTIGLSDVSTIFIPTGKVAVGNASKLANSVFRTTSKVYDDLGRKVYIKQQEIPIVKHFGYEEINDIFNSNMPATTKIGQLYGTGIGIGNELYKFYTKDLDKDKDND